MAEQKAIFARLGLAPFSSPDYDRACKTNCRYLFINKIGMIAAISQILGRLPKSAESARKL